MVGGRIDPQFGPLVVVGLGGIMVELVKDTALAVAPISPIQARDLLGQLKGRSALSGFRGIPAVDLDQLSNTIARFSEFLADHEACLKEVDVNPLICSGSEIVSVDALIVTREPQGSGRRI
jgi:acetate---CoA ligase (ADP-forming)